MANIFEFYGLFVANIKTEIDIQFALVCLHCSRYRHENLLHTSGDNVALQGGGKIYYKIN